MRFTGRVRCSGVTAISAMMVEQLGLATKPPFLSFHFKVLLFCLFRLLLFNNYHFFFVLFTIFFLALTLTAILLIFLFLVIFLIIRLFLTFLAFLVRIFLLYPNLNCHDNICLFKLSQLINHPCEIPLILNINLLCIFIYIF